MTIPIPIAIPRQMFAPMNFTKQRVRNTLRSTEVRRKSSQLAVSWQSLEGDAAVGREAVPSGGHWRVTPRWGVKRYRVVTTGCDWTTKEQHVYCHRYICMPRVRRRMKCVHSADRGRNTPLSHITHPCSPMRDRC